MPSFTCYKLHDSPALDSPPPADAFLELTGRTVTQSPPFLGDRFVATTFIVANPVASPPWTDFLRAAFMPGDLPHLSGFTSGAVIIVRDEQVGHFAFCFGPIGRHLLRDDSWVRSYGLRVALNAIYPLGGAQSPAPGRLIALDAKRRGAEIVRSRRQASRPTTAESLDLDQTRELLHSATGEHGGTEPWGSRLTGSDALHFTSDDTYDTLGSLCREIHDVHARLDYQATFGWIDHVRPVVEPGARQALTQRVVELLRDKDVANLSLAPPEIIDWSRVEVFQFHFDHDQFRPLPRLIDYLAGLDARKHLAGLTDAYLKNHRMVALDGNHVSVEHWSIWRCLSGEVPLDGAAYILDDGEFYSVEPGFLSDLNNAIATIPDRSGLLPSCASGTWEGDYNAAAQKTNQGWLLLDKKTIKIEATTTAVEVCDLLTPSRELIHVKRHLGSSELSHLFAQGLTSATLLQDSSDFLRRADAKIQLLSSMPTDLPRTFFSRYPITPGDFEIVYAIISEWKGRTLEGALPFFSKINLRHTVQALRARGFRVSHCRVDET